MEATGIKSEDKRTTMEDTKNAVEVKDEIIYDTDITYKCPQCQLVFNCLLALDNHIRFHTFEHPFECENCHQSFRTGQELYSHGQSSKYCESKVKPDISENQNCIICQKVLSTPYALLRHMRLHTGERPFRCVECHETFIDTGQLSKHMVTHKGNSNLQCKLCNKVCISEKRLADHMFSHNGKKRYQCPVCDKICKCKSHLDDHLRIHSGEKPFECALCDVSYRYKSQLREHHLTKHSPSEDYEDDVPPGKARCEICNAIISKNSMRHHKLLHNSKQFKCHRCPKTYVTQYRLNIHQRSHSGDKPFQCDISGCGKAMSTKDGLLRHKVIHEGKKDFKCSECDKEFFFRSNLNQHLKTHFKTTERFPCQRCDKCFSRKSILRAHMMTCLGMIIVDQTNFDANAKFPVDGSTLTATSIQIKSNQEPNYELEAVASSDRPDGIRANDLFALQTESTMVFFDTNTLKMSSLVTNEPSTEGGPIVFNNVIPPSNEAVLSSQPSSEHSYHNQSRQKDGSKTVFVEDDQTVDPDYLNGTFPIDEEESCKAVATQTVTDKRQTKTTLHKLADKIIRVEHPNDFVFTDDDISNLMTLAGVSTGTQDIPTAPNESEVSVKFVYSEQDLRTDPKSDKDQEPCDQNSQSISEPKQTSSPDREESFQSTPEQVVCLGQAKVSAPGQASTSVPKETCTSVPKETYTSVPKFISDSVPKETCNPHKVATECPPPEDNSEQLPNTGSANVDSQTASNLKSSDTEIVENETSPKASLDKASTSDLQQKASREQNRTEKSKDSLELRSNEVHGGLNETFFLECLHCDSCFRFHYALEEHCELQHPGEDVYKCFDCTATFDSTRSLWRHSRIHNGNSIVQCQECQRMFSHPQKLANHMVKHFGERVKRFRCDSCGHRFVDSTHLRDHMMVHTGIKPYECSECSLKFTRKREWETHVRIHTGELPFKCTKCEKSFRAATYLRNHNVTHSETKPFQCSECDKGYFRRSKLRLHMMIHNGTKPYKCEEPGCEKSYCEKREFVHHTMIHRGEKPYHCRVCNKAFTMKGNMVQHERIHNRP